MSISSMTAAVDDPTCCYKEQTIKENIVQCYNVFQARVRLDNKTRVPVIEMIKKTKVVSHHLC